MAAQRLSALYSTAFVTGASAGLGRAFTEMLLSEGVHVWGTSRDAAKLTDLASRAPAAFTPVILDLSAPDASVAAFGRAAKSAGGSFDLLISNAGYGVFAPFGEADFDLWRRQLDSMLIGTVELAHVALRQMRTRGRGCLVNVSSLAVEFPLPFMAGYNIAKAGLAALSESLLIETRGTGIRVIDFRPGDYATDFNQSMHIAAPAEPQLKATTSRAWAALERNLQDGPAPRRAADDLRRALRRQHCGVVRSGGIFQARVAPFFARFVPQAIRRRAAARYFGL